VDLEALFDRRESYCPEFTPPPYGGGNTQAADWDRAKARSLVGGGTQRFRKMRT